MAAKLSPVLNSQIFDDNGNPLIGGTIETYLAGSSTPLNTFTDANGLITQTNPIVLNALGQSDNLIWLTSGSLYKFIVKDSLGNVQNTLDNIQGVNELVVNLDQWISSAITPTYINATTFSLSGDQTSIYQIGRRLRLSVTAGTLYGAVQSAIYGASTTVTVKLDSGVLDAGLSSLSYGILTPDNSSLPSIFEDYRQTIIATATTTPLWDAVGKIQDWTGTPIITNFPAAPQAGSQRIVYPAPGTVITDNANIYVQGNASYTVIAGDELTITAITTTTFYVTIKRKDGLAVVLTNSIAQLDSSETITDSGANGQRTLTIDGVVRETQTAASRTSTIDGGTTLYPEFKCRAWVCFNGTGTPAILASGNVSSITDLGVGNYRINFTTAMPDANYAVSGSGSADGVSSCYLMVNTQAGKVASSVEVIVTNNAGTAVDRAVVSVTIFR